MAQFRELQAFAQFGTSDLDAATRRQLERGQRLSALLVQPEQQQLAMSTQVALLYAANAGILDDVPVNKINDFANGASEYLSTSHRDLLGGIGRFRTALRRRPVGAVVRPADVQGHRPLLGDRET